MHEAHRVARSCHAISIALLLFAASAAWAVPTAFTYQGKLTDAGSPANGSYDIQFRLFDTSAVGTGTQHGSPQERFGVVASAGIFTVTLDFGNPFNVNLYLEIGVRPGGSGPNPYTPLGTRQPITSSPYAIETINSQQLGGLPAARYVATDAAGNVGIGTASPQQTLQVNGITSLGPPGSIYAYLVDGPAPGPYPTLGFNTYGGPFYASGAAGYGSLFQYHNGDGSLTYYTGTYNLAGEYRDFIPRFTILQNGAVGIGTVTPGQARLNVRSGTVENAIFGENTSNGAGVVGGSSSGVGVYAGSTSGDGMYSTSTSGNGLTATSTYSYGVHGVGTYFVGVYGEGADSGVKGSSPSGAGVRGLSTNGTGVYGESAVPGTDTNAGVFGKGTGAGGIGVIGRGDTVNGVGVYGTSSTATGFALYGRANAGGRGLYLEGNAGQDLANNGIVKAMAYINSSGAIVRCFNGVYNVSTGNCLFAVGLSGGVFTVNFGFPVSNRFVAVTPQYGPGNSAPNNMGAMFEFINSTSINVITFDANAGEDPYAWSFMIILF